MPNNIKQNDQEIDIVPWEDIQLGVAMIASWLEEVFPSRKVSIYGIPRGGMIPAIMLAHQLDKEGWKTRFAPDLNHLTPTDLHNLIVIDDICDSGDTINVIRQLFPMCKVAVLFERKLDWEGQPCKTDFRCHMIRDRRWLQFPWEVS